MHLQRRHQQDLVLISRVGVYPKVFEKEFLGGRPWDKGGNVGSKQTFFCLLVCFLWSFLPAYHRSQDLITSICSTSLRDGHRKRSFCLHVWGRLRSFCLHVLSKKMSQGKWEPTHDAIDGVVATPRTRAESNIAECSCEASLPHPQVQTRCSA